MPRRKLRHVPPRHALAHRFPLFDALRKCINAEMPGESNRNQKHTIHTQKHTTLQTQQERMDDDGCFFGAWSKETYPMRRSEWTMATACHVLKVDKLDKQRRKGLKGNEKSTYCHMQMFAIVCFKNFWVPTCIWLTWHLQSFFFTFCRYPPTSSETKSVWETLKRLPANRVLRGYSWGSRVYRFLGQRLRSVSA